MYKINPSKYNGIFVLPAEIADRYLKLLSTDLLKAVIYLYRNADKTVDEHSLASGTGLSEEQAQEALQYWCNEGIITDCNKETASEKASVETVTQPEEKKEEKIIIKPKPGRLSYQQICSRLEESDMVRTLFSEAQLKLGRTIGSADQSALLNLHDYYGLPVEVILCICEYAKNHGKSNNLNYIFSVGTDWSVREIDSIEAADEELRKLENISTIWKDFTKLTGIKTPHPTASQSKYLNIWSSEWNFSLNMISLAFEEMSNHTESISFPYMNKILSEWHSAGIKTPEEAQERQQKFKEEQERKILQKANKKSPYGVRSVNDDQSTPASYDIEKATEYMNTTVPTYRKKEKR